MRNVPVSGAVITDEDINAVVETAKKGWFTEGEKSKEFAKALKTYIGTRHASLCNSGSSANLLALTALINTYKGKHHSNYAVHYVVTCATGFPTTITPIIQNGCIPMFVDANPSTLNPDTDMVLRALERPNVIGVILAHTLGFPFDAKAIREKCDEKGKFLIEDCADALGTEIYGKKVGSFSHASTFSFFPAHHITTGEGGAVLTNDGELFKLINSYRDWGRDCWCKPGDDNTCNNRFGHEWDRLPEGWDHKYTFTNLGYNLKMTELQAALGLSQLSRASEIYGKRASNYFHLKRALIFYNPLPPVWFSYETDFVAGAFINVSPFGFPLSIKSKEFTKQELVSYLEQNGIRTRPIFAGNITRHPMADQFYYEQIGTLEGSDFIMENTFWIGCHDALTKEDLDYVVETFYSFFKEKGLI